MKDVFAFWGCGNGLLKKSLHPYIRIVSGILVGCASLLVPMQSVTGVTIAVTTTVCWIVLAAMPIKLILRCGIISLILFFPFLLLSPWMAEDPLSDSSVTERITKTASIALRSACTLFIAASTIATLPIYDVHRGLTRLPLPRSLIALIVQLINQTMLLTEETMRIIGVLRLRGASGVHGFRVLFSFPIVWMVRMLFRAERTAAAMTVRGYGIEYSSTLDTDKLNAADTIALIVSSGLLCVSLFMRIRILL